MKVVTSLIFMCMGLLMAFSSFANNTYHASVLKDNSGLVYIGYKIDNNLIKSDLETLHVHLGDKLFKTYRANQIKRDHGGFHITLINPFEYPDIDTIDISKLPPVSFSFKGLGHGHKSKDNTYFVVALSNEAQELRQKFGLKKKDFHITLGFNTKDVFGIDKSVKSLIQ